MLLYDGALRIPLIVSGPGVPAGERREPVSVVDIAPTVLNRLGVPVPGSMAGVDLLGPGKPERDIYAETEYPLTAGWSALAALTDGRVKLIDAPDPELYDLDTDAAEARNTAGLRESAVNAMRSRLEQLRTAGPQAEAHQGIAPEVAERLRALGYVAGAPSPATGGRGANPASAIASWVRFEDALGMLATGDSRKALPVLTELATAHPDARVFRATQARALAEAGRPADALSRYRQLVARWPDDATLYHDLATTASAAGKADEARRAEQAALAIDPSYAAAWDGLGLLEASAGRAPEAKTAFQKAVEHDPTNAQFWTNLGNAARARGDTAGADRAYRQALSLDPALPDAANGLAVLFVEAGRPALAVPLLEDVTRRHPDFYEAWLNLGIACQQAGRIAEARAAYARVLAAPPRFARERSAAAQLARGLPRER
jgi:Flp pilus assembly protein TadD